MTLFNKSSHKAVCAQVTIVWIHIFVILAFSFSGNTWADNKNLNFLTPIELEWLKKLDKPIRLAPDPGFSPMEIKGPKGELLGMAGEYVNILEQILGVSFKIIWYDTWAESVRQAKQGNVDLWSAVISTPQRREYMAFTQPYIQLKPVFIVVSQSGQISFDTLENKRLILIEGWYHHDLIKNKYPQIDITLVSSLKDGFFALQKGKADVLVADTVEAYHTIQELNLKNLRIAGNADLDCKGLSMACRKDWPLFRSIIDKTLARITDNQKNEIYQRWVSLESEKYKKGDRWFHKIGLFIFTGIALFLMIAFICLHVAKQSCEETINIHKKIIIWVILVFFLLIVGLVWKYAVVKPEVSSNDIDLTSQEKTWLSSLKTPLTIAPDCGFAPVEWVDNKGAFKGIAAEYVKLVEKKLGIKFKIMHIRNWNKNVAAAKKGGFDIWTAVSATPEKQKYMNFSPPHIKLTSALIVNSADTSDFNLETIGSQRVAVVQNYFTHDYLKQHYPDINLMLVQNASDAMRALAFRQVDAVFADIATASYIIRQEGITSLEVRQTMDIGYNLSFASRKGLPILNHILDKTVASISDQEHEIIMEKWAGAVAGKGIQLIWIIEISLMILAVLLAMLVWTLSLRRLVNIRTKELIAVQESLIKANNYITNIVDSMPSILVGVDIHGNITQWNKTAEKAKGISFEDAKGKKFIDLFPYMSSISKIIDNSIKNRNTEQVHKIQRQLENNKNTYEDVTVYPLIANGVEGAVIRIDDIADKVRMEEMMIQSEKMLSVGGLAAGMAHEINNPLAGMIQTANVMSNRLSNIEMTANKSAAKEAGITMEGIKLFMEKRSILRMVKTINKSGQRVAQIVDNMLSFARKSDTLVSTYDIAELMDKTLEIASTDYDLKKQYDFKTVEIVKEYEKNLPLVPCEGAKIQQVLLNILRNGAQAMQEAIEKSNLLAVDSNLQHPRFILRLFRERKTAMIRIEIEDNGSGMDEETRKRIFEPFFTTKPAGIGTGLGLSVSYFIIVENHRGLMDVISEPGKGARFIICLPLGRPLKR